MNSSDSAVTKSTSNIDNSENESSPLLRFFFVGMALFLMLFVLLGFGSTYGMQLLMDKEISGSGLVEADWVIHIHAIVFVGWMTLLLTQTILVARAKTRKHMAVGKKVGGVLAAAVLMAGSLIIYTQIQAAVSKELVTWAEWRAIVMATLAPWFALLGFAMLVGLALFYRKQPEEHKRYMIFATILLAVPATSRMEYLLGPWSNNIGISIMMAPPIAYDIYTEHRMRNATLVGMGFLAVFLIIINLLG
ncbi:hypothetical protein NC796_24385 [Aliifodinibius sp. S!AR15-10]|uniref:hypothetical protein n=1 Tax=Aliifodinibius sp. S!AR15-10 TaxID=2950437 RepID=UPI00285CEA99|nr:hypothetical protein [Aliifodinibius sp. S!AR15-10]MDR8394309.1 hypothetical protein [Aliifodinibius sp. S!AR15-10]